MFPSARFLRQLRQYASLEAQMNKDFTDPILVLASAEIARLISVGVSQEQAVNLINQTLTNEVTRFPIDVENQF